MRVSLICIALLFGYCLATAQSFNPSPRSSPDYVYRITSEEALYLQDHQLKSTDTSFFHDLVGIYDDFEEKPGVPFGHYLAVSVNEAKLNYTYIPIAPWHIYILDNAVDMIVQLTDVQTGSPFTAALLEIDHSEIPFDPETVCYKINKANKAGVLTVRYEGLTFYYEVTKERNSSILGRIGSVSRKYLLRPVSFLAHLPVDGVKSIRKKKAQGSIVSLKQAVHKVSTLFASKKEAFEDRDKWEMEQEFKSYFFFSKPKYRERDTVRFKAHILNENTKQWINDELWVTLNDGTDEFYYIAKIKPERLGDGYSFQFALHDSMMLDLDDEYAIELKNKDSVTIAWGMFQYEDYELNKAVFKAELLSEEAKHFKGKPFEVMFTAKDENGLPMRDTRAEVYITLNSAYAVKPDTLFVPDTLWHHTFTIEDGEKTVPIPDSIFPLANIRYRLNIVMQNSEQEREEQRFNPVFLDDVQEVEIVAEEDSVIFKSKGGVIHEKIHIYATDRFDIRVTDTSVYLPYAAPLNTHVQKYSAEADADDVDLNLDRIDCDLGLDLYRNLDSVFINLVNPRRLPVVYHLYKNNKEVARGQGKMIKLSRPAVEKDEYYITIEYVWAGKAEIRTRAILLPKSIVNLNIQQPSVIYPGRETEISITATDYKKDPVSDMSILAYAFTDKFSDYDQPHLPYLGAYAKGRKRHNMFSLEEGDQDVRRTSLNFRYWNKVMHLDTSWRFRFLFPQRNTIEYFHAMREDSVTQIAPFVVEKGVIQPVYYVLINGVPVYFGFTDSRIPYSFPMDTVAEVKIRTPRQLITINHVRPERYHRTFFSVDPGLPYRNVNAESYPDTFTAAEKIFLSYYIMGFDKDNILPGHAYMSDGWKNIHAINNGKYRYSREKFWTHGPVTWKYWRLGSIDNFSVPFEFEPFYQYSFKEGLVKMKNLDPVLLVPSKPNHVTPSFGDVVLTDERFYKDYQAEIKGKRLSKVPHNIFDTIRGEARLSIEIGNSPSDPSPLNIILFKPDDFSFIKIFPGTTRSFNYLPRGRYELLFVEPGGIYRQTGIITIKDNGENFYRFRKVDTLKDKNINRIDTLLSRIYQSGNNTTAITQMMSAYVQGTYKGPTRMVKGNVLDEKGEAIIGATIILERTTIGTVTDAGGNFELNIPAAITNPRLEVRYVGLKTTTVLVTRQELKIIMDAGDSDLGEVSIYGRKLDRKSFTGSISTVTSKDIARRPITEITKALEGSAPGVAMSTPGRDGSAQIMIRGQNTFQPDSNVLVVIDGAIYSGGLASLDPDIVASLTVLKDATATSIYGSRGAKGVVLITTKKGVRLPENIRKGLESPIMPEALMASSLRSNFRDDAYWQPNLRTDKNGKATFKVKFPDDITAWKTFVFATDAKKHTGQASGLIKSYKPLSASLHMPAFLLQGDTAQLLGKSVSYVPDTIAATTSYFVQNVLTAEQKIKLSKFHNDTLQLVAGKIDSIRLKYMLRKDDGYFDGEEKTMPVLPKGVLVATGAFLPLDMPDTTFTLPAIGAGDTLYLSAMASLLDIVDDEIRIVGEYEHLCNEQLASKIIASLNQQRISEVLQRPFEDRDKIQEMIDKLLQRQNAGRLWGWWESGETVYWISDHVIHALLEAQSMQYSTRNLNFETILQPMLYEWQTDTAYADLQSLKLLHRAGIKADYERFISRLERKKNVPLSQRLALMLMRRQAGLPYDTKQMLAMQKEDIFGNIYWKDSVQTINENELLTTLTALKILQADSSIPINKNKVINWLLQQRGAGGWRNIYESSQIIEAIAKYLPLRDKKAMQAKLTLSSGHQETITQFPYRKRLTTQEPVTVSKQGAYPVYFTWYRQHRDTTNIDLGKNFVVSSSFEEGGKSTAALHAGVPVTMEVTITVKKSAEFVMIEIPIPAGCSYDDKRQPYYGHEVHREYRKNKVSIFCQRLPEGTHKYTIALLPRYSGTYTLNPAKAELMYFPVFYGRSVMKTVNIR